MVKFADWDDAKVWLEGQPKEKQAVFILRSAMRSFPQVVLEKGETNGSAVLWTLRGLLTLVAATDDPSLLEDEGRRNQVTGLTAAASARVENRDSSMFAAGLANLAAALHGHDWPNQDQIRTYAVGHTARVYTTREASSWMLRGWPEDATKLDSGLTPKELAGDPISAGPLPPEVEDAYVRLRAFWRQNPAVWRFWQQWYAATLGGVVADAALVGAIASIPNSVWAEGPDRVAQEIAQIEAEVLSRKLPLAETIRFNEESATFFVEPVEVANPRLLAATLAQVSDALDDVLERPSNGLDERSREIKELRRALGRDANDPQQIEIKFTSVHRRLIAQMSAEVAELPPSEENIALADAVLEAAQWIRANYPEIDANRRMLNAQAKKELPPDDRQAAQAAVPVLEAISEGVLAEDWGLDAALIASAPLGHHAAQVSSYQDRPSPYSHAPDEWRRVLENDAEARFYGRVARVYLTLRKLSADQTHKLYDSAAFKLVGLVGGSVSLLELLRKLIEAGLNLFR